MTDQMQEDHLSGKHVVVSFAYADGKVESMLLDEMGEEAIEIELWQDAAFTNGAPLVEIKLRWDKAHADELRAHFETQKESEE